MPYEREHNLILKTNGEEINELNEQTKEKIDNTLIITQYIQESNSVKSYEGVYLINVNKQTIEDIINIENIQKYLIYYKYSLLNLK